MLCVDEKSQCQALERTQPMLPMGFGYVEGVTHDYKRHGTTTCSPRLNVLNGAVLANASRAIDIRSSSPSCARSTRPCRPIWTCTASSTTTPRHKHPKVKAWLASRPRWHMHFVPTYSSWLNQVERFFALITDTAIRRGSFDRVKRLDPAHRSFVDTSQRELQTLHAGLPPPIRSSKSCIDFVHESAGQHTNLHDGVMARIAAILPAR